MNALIQQHGQEAKAYNDHIAAPYNAERERVLREKVFTD